MLVLILLAICFLAFKPRYVEWILFYILGHIHFGNTVLGTVNFFLWYVFVNLPKQFMSKMFIDYQEFQSNSENLDILE
ncbi:SH (U3) putative protein [Bimbo virus]|uniref:Uncharacterized protein n=1 Tax=Bimbo virus TaxID=864694 RepID=A0AAE8XBL7_9RHAB|nr:SH (U3) putative protein [Bimbo virus]UAU42871.1 SH (U3) putative protein [Bimbo virus]WAD86854.1 hypothetical protein [Bimbo virus]